MGFSCKFPPKPIHWLWENCLASLAGHRSQDVTGNAEVIGSWACHQHRWSLASIPPSTWRLSSKTQYSWRYVAYLLYIGEWPYALGLFCLIFAQVYFAKTLFIENPIENDVKYQGSSLPFFSIGTIVAASAIGNTLSTDVLRDFPLGKRTVSAMNQKMQLSWRSSHLPDKATQSAGYNMDPMGTVDMLILRSPVRYWVNPQVG